MASFYLHVGMPKNASTYLQQNVFPHLSDIYYLNKPTSAILDCRPFQGIFAKCFLLSPTVWSLLGERIFDEFAIDFKDNANPTDVLLSDEGITGSLGFHLEENRGFVDPYRVAGHLREIRRLLRTRGFDDLKVILIFRRQDKRLASGYSQISDGIVFARQSDFLRRVHAVLDINGSLASHASMLRYDILYREIARVVGEDNLLMRPFEALNTEQTSIENDIEAFSRHALHAEPKPVRNNVRSTGRDAWMIRPLDIETLCDRRTQYSRLVRYAPWKLKRLLEKSNRLRENKIYLDREVSLDILARFKSSNEAMSELARIDLSRWEYH